MADKDIQLVSILSVTYDSLMGASEDEAMEKSMERAIDECHPEAMEAVAVETSELTPIEDEEDNKLEEKILAYPVLPAPFQCTNVPGWEKRVNSNKAPYGRACVVFAAEWAKNMDEAILKTDSTKGFTALSSSQIEEASSKADNIVGGITSFMYGAVIQMLSECWRYGKDLKEYHNRQYGVENADGVVNPAILTIGEGDPIDEV